MLIKAQESGRLLQYTLESSGTSEITSVKLHNHLCTGRVNLNWKVCRKELEGSLGNERPFKRFE